MPDQLPSAILDGTNSFDSIFALDIDTKQRFDNILNNQQKPIDYPIPDYNKDFTPQGLPQDDLLNPSKMKGTLGEAMFSPDIRVSQYATDKIRQSQAQNLTKRGIGVPDRYAYSKEMNKFLSGDYGYNPYQSIEDNEDFNYRYDYLSQGVFERVFKNIGVGTGRFLGSVLMKLGQTAGYMGSMVGNGIEEIFNSKENNFMSDVADNSLSRWFEGLEEDMKNSNTLSVFKPKGWEDKGFFNKLGNGAFWTDEVADGAAFMGEMVASMYLLGGLGKIGALGRLGSTEINLAKSLGKLGSLGKYSGKGLDFALKLGTGADNLSGIGRWAFATTSESAFEAAGLYKQRKEELKADRMSGRNSYTDDEIEAIAGDSAAGSFKANMLVLSASNAFENKFIFNPLFKKFGVKAANPKSRLININEGTSNLDELAQASRRQYNYKTWLGKKLDWKNSNSRLWFYGGRGLSAVAAEGFWEENAQLAIERLSSADNLSFRTFAEKLKDQTLGALTGDDPEAATNIGLGAVIGIGGTGIVSKVAGGDNKRYKINPKTGEFVLDKNGNKEIESVPLLQRGERRKIENDTAAAVALYEEQRRKFLNFQDIYVRDENGKPVLDADGNMEIDDLKAAAVFDGMNAFASKQEAASKVYDPLFRKYLQDNAMMDFVTAAKSAGIFDRSSKRLSSLGNLTQTELENLGFDPNTTVDTVYLRDSLQEFGKIYEDVQSAPSARLGKQDKPEDELNRKNALYKAKATVYSATKLMNEYQSVMMDRNFPSVFDPSAEGSTSEIQAYNSLVFQKESLQQWGELAKENGSFYDGFIRQEQRRIDAEMRRLEEQIDDMMESSDLNVVASSRGFLTSVEKYSDLKPTGEENYTSVNAGKLKTKSKIRFEIDAAAKKGATEADMFMDLENQAQAKHAQMMVSRNKHQYLASKFGNLQDGIANFKDYMKFHDNIQKKDAATENNQSEQQPEPAVVPEAGSATQVQPQSQPQPKTQTGTAAVTKKETVDSSEVIIGLTNLLTSARAAFILNDPTNPPNYGAVSAFINEKTAQHKDVIIKKIDEFNHSVGDPVIDSIKVEKLDRNSEEFKMYISTSDMMSELSNSIDDNDIANTIINYFNSVDDDVNIASNPKLSTLEQVAIDTITAVSIPEGSIVSPYTDVILDPNSTVQAKKDALRGLSDQLLATNTAVDTEEVLGRRAAEAVQELGYEKPAESEELNELANSEVTEATVPLIALFAHRIASGEQMTEAEDLQFYENNKEAIEAKLREMASPAETVTIPAPNPVETQEEEAVEESQQQLPVPADMGIVRNIPPVGPLTEKVSDRFVKRYPETIEGLPTQKLIELASMGEEEPLDASYFDAEEKLLLEFGENAEKYYLHSGSYPNGKLFRISKREAEFFRDNPDMEDFMYKMDEENSGRPRENMTGPEFARYLLDQGAIIYDTYQLNLFPETGAPAVTQAQEASSDTEGSGVDTPPPTPPVPPVPPINSDEEELAGSNYIDDWIDNNRRKGLFTGVQIMPEEIVMDGDKAKIVDGAIQLKTTTSDQARQLKRQHNILKVMGEKTNPVNFWSEDEEGKPLFKIRLEMGGRENEAKYEPWVYQTGKGIINQKTGKPNLFPFIVAMVVDQDGNYVYFDDNGNVTSRSKGMPFGFTYGTEDYYTNTIRTTRRGNQLGTGEPLSGPSAFIDGRNYLKDMSDAVMSGADIFGTIDFVTSGKLSTYNVDNSSATWAKTPKMRTIRQMIDDGDLSDSTPMVLGAGRGEYTEFISEREPGLPTQRVKIGQGYMIDEKTGYRIPMRGKKLKDLTINGQPLIEGELKAFVEELNKDGVIKLDEYSTLAQKELLKNLFTFMRTLVYSQNTPVYMNEAETEIRFTDNRPDHKSLMDTEVNFSTGIEFMSNPFEVESEGFSYDDFVKENFMSGAVPAELTKGQKNFEKLNKRIIFTLDYNHQQLLDVVGAKTDTSKSLRLTMTDHNKFLNKTYRKRGGDSSIVTVTGYSDGKFTIVGKGGEKQQSVTDFIKSLRGLEEVTTPPVTDEIKQEFEKPIYLSEEDERRLNEEVKNMTQEDLDNLNFDC